MNKVRLLTRAVLWRASSPSARARETIPFRPTPLRSRLGKCSGLRSVRPSPARLRVQGVGCYQAARAGKTDVGIRSGA